MEYYGQIYKILNTINNKIYIGITTLDDVIKNRYSGSIANTHNKHLKRAINKYGIENFEVSTIDRAYSQVELESKEKDYIGLYNSTNKQFGYNVCIGGEGVHGYIASEDTKQILSKKSKEMWNNHPEYKENLIKRNTGENNPLVKKGGHSEESKRKMSISKKELIKSGVISLEKAIEASKSPEAIEKRIISQSKYILIQYDESFNELNKWHTLKNMYLYMINNNIENNITYGGFKNKNKQLKVFNEEMYNGFYWRKIKKEEYVN